MKYWYMHGHISVYNYACDGDMRLNWLNTCICCKLCQTSYERMGLVEHVCSYAINRGCGRLLCLTSRHWNQVKHEYFFIACLFVVSSCCLAIHNSSHLHLCSLFSGIYGALSKWSLKGIPPLIHGNSQGNPTTPVWNSLGFPTCKLRLWHSMCDWWAVSFELHCLAGFTDGYLVMASPIFIYTYMRGPHSEIILYMYWESLSVFMLEAVT